MGNIESLHQPQLWNHNSEIGKDGRRRLSIANVRTYPSRSEMGSRKQKAGPADPDRLPSYVKAAVRRASLVLGQPSPSSTAARTPTIAEKSSDDELGGVTPTIAKKSSDDGFSDVSDVSDHEVSRNSQPGGTAPQQRTGYAILPRAKKSQPQDSPSQRRSSMMALVSSMGSLSLSLVTPTGTHGGQSELSFAGIGAFAAASAYGCYALRLTFRDLLADFQPFARLSRGKQLVVELYMLGTVHAAAWAIFSLRKIFTGKWDDPSGTTRAIGLSSGYYLHDFIVLRSLFTQDPFMFLHHLCQLVMHAGMLRSEGADWLVPTSMLHVIPNFPLNLLRILKVLGARPGATVARLLMALYTSTFLLTNSIGVPSVCSYNWVGQPKPEFHQPSYLPVKLCLGACLAICHYWFKETLTGAEEVLRFAGSDMSMSDLRGAALRRIGITIGAVQLVGQLSIYVAGPAGLPLMFLLWRRGFRRFALAGLGGLLGLTISPLPAEGKSWFVHSRMVKWILGTMSKYFNFKVVQEAPLQKDRRYLCGMYPHGFSPLGMPFMCHEWHKTGFLPAITGASVLFQLPILRQVLAYLGGVPASKQRIMKCLKKDFPRNITFITPGGIAEMFQVKRPDVEHIISERKGFVKCAIEAGADLVPIYVIGHTQMYHVIGGLIGRICEALSRWVRVSILAFHGRWGTPIPYSKPVVALVGRPIPTGKPIAKPSAELVDQLHQQFVEELAALFHKHKHLVPGWEDKELYLTADAKLPPPPESTLSEYSRSKL